MMLELLARQMSQERYEYKEKVRMIGLILDYADEKTKARVIPLLHKLPLTDLQAANPYAGNSSDDCHTFS